MRIASLQALEAMRRSWTAHHRLTEQQLEFADHVAEVERVGFYHGGDELYWLLGVPGVWHERCLSPTE